MIKKRIKLYIVVFFILTHGYSFVYTCILLYACPFNAGISTRSKIKHSFFPSGDILNPLPISCIVVAEAFILENKNIPFTIGISFHLHIFCAVHINNHFSELLNSFIVSSSSFSFDIQSDTHKKSLGIISICNLS